MTPRYIRATMLIGGFAVLAFTAFLALGALEDNLVYFRTPSELADTADTANSADNANKPVPIGQKLRIGGLVATNSLVREGVLIRFLITDTRHDVAVIYRGLLPDLFREGQGVVVEGAFYEAGLFTAHTVLAKHDENYMPPEVADALKKAGVWQGADSPPAQNTKTNKEAKKEAKRGTSQ